MKIGEKTWFRGNEITITTEPYELYGGRWQDGIDEIGKTVSVVAPAQCKVNAEKVKAEHKEQQAGFARLAAMKRSK